MLIIEIIIVDALNLAQTSPCQQQAGKQTSLTFLQIWATREMKLTLDCAGAAVERLRRV